MNSTTIAGRYEASLVPSGDWEPFEFSSNDLAKVKRWMAEKIHAFPSPDFATIIDTETEGNPALFTEVN